ncbi:MAG: hypothetical protein LQ346_007788 [Caloplaca aetnensis]|nr:MAG: hypothetical protein LQ346_007788 [Caloplaca aetnensis]
MFLSTSILSTLVLAGAALAQYGSDSGYGSDSSYGSGSSGSGSSGSGGSDSSSSMSMTASPASSPAASAGTATPSGMIPLQVVKVSNKEGTLKFYPDSFDMAAGSMVQFQFYPKNHSVVRSTFDQPCQPIKNNNASAVDLFSGFMPVKPTDTMRPVYTIRINDTKPIWFYCSKGDHCQEGMVGVINPPAANKSRTIESFTALAKQATENLSPGQSSSSGSSSDSDSTGSSTSGSGSYGSSGSSGSSGSYSGSSGSSSSSSAAAPVPVASGSGSSSGFTMPLAGTNSSSPTTGAASPSGSAGGQAPQSFVPGSDANAFASRMDILRSFGLAGLVGLFVAGLL